MLTYSKECYRLSLFSTSEVSNIPPLPLLICQQVITHIYYYHSIVHGVQICYLSTLFITLDFYKDVASFLGPLSISQLLTLHTKSGRRAILKAGRLNEGLGTRLTSMHDLLITLPGGIYQITLSFPVMVVT